MLAALDRAFLRMRCEARSAERRMRKRLPVRADFRREVAFSPSSACLPRLSARCVVHLILPSSLKCDILVQICSYLRPLDLLTMARSCKLLRDFFMSKASAPAWVASRRAIELPDCPSDLSEPQYADLLFSKGCYVSLLSFLLQHFLNNLR